MTDCPHLNWYWESWQYDSTRKCWVRYKYCRDCGEQIGVQVKFDKP